MFEKTTQMKRRLRRGDQEGVEKEGRRGGVGGRMGFRFPKANAMRVETDPHG